MVVRDLSENDLLICYGRIYCNSYCGTHGAVEGRAVTTCFSARLLFGGDWTARQLRQQMGWFVRLSLYRHYKEFDLTFWPAITVISNAGDQ